MARVTLNGRGTYPGQCVHAWSGPFERQTCLHGCGSTCRRGETGKIESYSAGKALLAIEEPAWMKRVDAAHRAKRGGAR